LNADLPKRLPRASGRRRAAPSTLPLNPRQPPKTKLKTVSQSEVETLYERFRRLDRQRTGFISAEALMGIPELSINPLAQRLVRMVESANFTEFVRVLAAFSSRTPREDKVRFIFEVYDVDGDGVVSREDMSVVLRQLGGAGLADAQVHELIDRAFGEAGVSDGLRPGDFAAALKDQDLSGMVVTVPSEF
jgi:serine/threonine-protein phosphatase 2B regulatory subunit